MTTRPVGMRAELRDWYYSTGTRRYVGLVYEDVHDFILDGTFIAIYAKDLKEVRPMKDVTIFEFKNGERWYALAATRKADT